MPFVGHRRYNDILEPSMSTEQPLFNQITPTLTSHHHVKSKLSLYTSNHSITTNDFEDICQLLELTIFYKLHTNHVRLSLILSCLTKYIRWQLVIVSSNCSSSPIMWYLIVFLLPFDIPKIKILHC